MRYLAFLICFLASVAQAEGFRAQTPQDLSGGWWAGAYTLVELPDLIYGSNYAQGCWTAPSDGEVSFNGQLWVLNATNPSGGAPNYVGRIVKNGGWITFNGFASVGKPGHFPDTSVITLGGSDWASVGATYCLYLYVENMLAVVDRIHTWFGATFRPAP